MRPPFFSSLLLSAIRFYQRWLSPMLGTRCRFHPSCSHYTAAAVERFGILRGGLLGGFRLLRCQPLSDGGFDAVPQTFTSGFWRRNPDRSPLVSPVIPTPLPASSPSGVTEK